MNQVSVQIDKNGDMVATGAGWMPRPGWPEFLLAVLAVLFTAFCIWLAVRMINGRKRPGWKFCVPVIILSLVIYDLSGSPFELLNIKYGGPPWIREPMRWFYAPLAWSLRNGPEWHRQLDSLYDNWWQEILFETDDEPER
jgi:hypothetical protein